MSSDDPNSDKTVFRQQTSGGGRTVMKKPVPGGRTQLGRGQATAHYEPRTPARADTSAEFHGTSRGLNPLVNAAAILLAVFEKTRSAVSHSDVGGLYQRLKGEINAFDARARNLGISTQTVISARFILCTILDEAVLNTPWGAESAWHSQTLLSFFHKTTAGGDKFYDILDGLKKSPNVNLHILELMYICLSLGFKGKYSLSERGHEKIENLRAELFSIFRTHRGDGYEKDLSPSWQGLGGINNNLTQYVPLWVVASIVGAVLFFSYSGFRYWLYNSSVPVVSQLENITESKPVTKRRLF